MCVTTLKRNNAKEGAVGHVLHFLYSPACGGGALSVLVNKRRITNHFHQNYLFIYSIRIIFQVVSCHTPCLFFG